MGSVEVQDQKAGALFLHSLPFVDPKRIAIDGWSYGGYMTLKMLEADPGLYAAGIAGAPVTKWELYDTSYTERYMGTPKDDAAAYAKSDALADAGEDPRPAADHPRHVGRQRLLRKQLGADRQAAA